jgi:hypothetical protein
MSRSLLVLLIIALSLGLYLWFIEMPTEQKRVRSESVAKRLVEFQESDVQGFVLRSPEGEVEVSRKASSADEWIIVKPKSMEADRRAVDEFLRGLILAKVNRVVDETGGDLSSYGLASPPMTVTLRLASGPQTIRFGDSGPLSSSLYAKRDADPKILLTTISARELLTKGVQDFRRKRVFEFERAAVTRLKVTTDEEVVLYKEGHGDKADWMIKAPVQTAADQPEVRSLLFGLEDLKAQGFLDDPKDRQAKKADLHKPLVRLTIHEEGRERSNDQGDRTIAFFLDPKNTMTAYAETTSQEPLYAIPAATAKDLAKSLFTLRNKRLITAEPEQVKTLVIKKDSEEYSLTHEGKDWLIDGNPGSKADAARINMLVSRIVRLQAERILPDKFRDLKLYGLAPPAADLTAADAQGKLLGHIAIGRQEAGLAFAVGSAMAGIFQVRPDVLADIPRKADLAR